MIQNLAIGAMLVLALVALFIPRKDSTLKWTTLAWSVAWGFVAWAEPTLWPVALLGFVQNVAFTFVSRGRNSGSLGYHLIASVFSNGIYAMLLFTSIDMISQAKSMPLPFLVVYTLTTMSGSIFAHWLALRAERGKAKTVQEDRLGALERRLEARIAQMGTDAATNLGEWLGKEHLARASLDARIRHVERRQG